jgi:hypothetical protein
MFSAPVPCAQTLAAMVRSDNGARNSHQSSIAGLSAVFHPS